MKPWQAFLAGYATGLVVTFIGQMIRELDERDRYYFYRLQEREGG